MSISTNTLVCDLCSSDDFTVVFKAGEAQNSQIVKCNKCGLMYSNPRAKDPDCVEIENYDPEFTRKVAESQRPRYEKEKLQVRDYAATKAYFNEIYPKRGVVLEVGCGMGFMLDYYRQDGWEVRGVEPNKGFCQYIDEEMKIDVVPKILEEANIPDATADIVILLHVIEHVPSPTATLSEIFRVLKPGGHLLMETPRYDSLTFKMLGRRERSVSCNGHIYFFTTDTLRKEAEKAGFESVKLQLVGRSLSMERLLWNIGVMSKSDKVQAGLTKLSTMLGLNKMTFSMNMRDMQRTIFRKPLSA
ncbi:class I SAM-dependent methyltransferase [Isosphaeraceae bacterium EP7]